jgi:hypothetical protein
MRVLLTLLVLLCFSVVAVGAVPDVRLTVSEVEVPDEALPDEPTVFEITVENSLGSDSAIELDSVAIEDEDGSEYASTENAGSLSPGDGLTVPLSVTFTEAGGFDLDIVATGTDENGEVVTIERPAFVAVGGTTSDTPTDDVQIDARTGATQTAETEDGTDVIEELLAEESEESNEDEATIEVDITNFGDATAREVVVTPSTDSETLSRIAVSDISPGETETVRVDPTGVEGESIDFEAEYVLGTQTGTSETAFERAGVGEVRITDADMQTDGETLTITGNAANPGTEPIDGVFVELEETEDITPTYPQRDYFVGTVPEGDFIGFELTAEVDEEGNDSVETVPLSMTYVVDGTEYDETTELEYAPTVVESEDNGSLLPWFVGVSGVLLLVGAIGVSYWRRADGGD